IGHRIDQTTDQVVPLRPDHVVLAPERDDPDTRPGARHSRHDVGVETRAVDEVARLDRARSGGEVESVARALDAGDPGARPDDGAPREKLPRDGLSDLPV